MLMHWPSLQVNSPSAQVVSFIGFTFTQILNDFNNMIKRFLVYIDMNFIEIKTNLNFDKS